MKFDSMMFFLRNEMNADAKSVIHKSVHKCLNDKQFHEGKDEAKWDVNWMSTISLSRSSSIEILL